MPVRYLFIVTQNDAVFNPVDILQFTLTSGFFCQKL